MAPPGRHNSACSPAQPSEHGTKSCKRAPRCGAAAALVGQWHWPTPPGDIGGGTRCGVRAYTATMQGTVACAAITTQQECALTTPAARQVWRPAARAREHADVTTAAVHAHGPPPFAAHQQHAETPSSSPPHCARQLAPHTPTALPLSSHQLASAIQQHATAARGGSSGDHRPTRAPDRRAHKQPDKPRWAQLQPPQKSIPGVCMRKAHAAAAALEYRVVRGVQAQAPNEHSHAAQRRTRPGPNGDKGTPRCRTQQPS